MDQILNITILRVTGQQNPQIFIQKQLSLGESFGWTNIIFGGKKHFLI